MVRLCEKDAIPSDWCGECGNTHLDLCLARSINFYTKQSMGLYVTAGVLGLSVFITFTVMIIFIVLYFKLKRQTYYQVENMDYKIPS